MLQVPTAEDMEDLGGLLATLLLQRQRRRPPPQQESSNAARSCPPPPALILLDGDLGAGKTCLARGFVRACTGNPHLRVTSPTYLLSNTYRTAASSVLWNNARNDEAPDDDDDDGKDDDNDEMATMEIHHMDLYRLSIERSEDLLPLNLDHVLKNCIALMEWPERLGSNYYDELLPNNRLEINITIPSCDDDTSSNDGKGSAANKEALQEEEGDDDVKMRQLKLTPIGKAWADRLETMVQEGYVDDLLPDEE